MSRPTFPPSALVFVLAAALGCSSTPARPTTVNAVRGGYLVRSVLACGDCHTTPQANGLPSFDPADFLAGGRELKVDGGGSVFTKNLTSDVKTGIGGWTDEEIKRALLRGIDDEGKALSPEMPYWAFGNMSDDDATSIVLFLRSLRAAAHDVQDNTAPTPAQPTAITDEHRIPHTTLAASDPKFASAERGRYLAGQMGACISCHTQNTGAHGVLDLGKAFGGGEVFDFVVFKSTSANLTPDATGLAGWQASEIIQTVQFAKEKGTGRALCPPMPAGPNRDGDMTPGDLADVAAYLTTLPPVANGPFSSMCPSF
jgi:mono/diheme cytochrome c family protein